MTASARRLQRVGSRKERVMTGLAKLEDMYLAHHQALGHSEKTVDHYRNTFLLLHRFLEETGKEATENALTSSVMNEFVAWLRETPTRGFRGSTVRTIDGIHGIMKDLRAFTRYLVAEELLERQPKVPVPKLPKHLFQVLSEAELEAIFSSRQLDTRTEIGTRNRALVAFMLDTGVRLSEVANLTLAQLNLKDGAARVVGKGNKERMVYYSDGTKAAVKQWLSIRGDEPGEVFWLRPAGVRQVMERIKRETGIKVLFAHQLRHTCFTQLVARGVDLHTVKRLAGHSSLSVTEGYLNLSGSEMKAKLQIASPYEDAIRKLEPNQRPRRRLRSA